jgi:hypothetical protein
MKGTLDSILALGTTQLVEVPLPLLARAAKRALQGPKLDEVLT